MFEEDIPTGKKQQKMKNVVFLIKSIPVDLNPSCSESRIRIFSRIFFLKRRKKKICLSGNVFCPAPTTTGHKHLVYRERSDLKSSQNQHRM